MVYSYPARALIDIAAITHNAKLLLAKAPNTQHLGVVKADAYGHGHASVAVALARAGYRAIGVAQIEEALAVRDALDIAGFYDVMLFSWVIPADGTLVASEAIERGIEVAASTPVQVAMLNDCAMLRNPARLHLKIDTGMSRAGATLDEFAQLIEDALAAPNIKIVGVWSHLACADELTEDGMAATNAQKDVFDRACQMLSDYGVRDFTRHLGATSVTLWHPQLQYDMVRDGIGIYGLTPNPETASSEELGLMPVMNLSANLMQVKRIKQGAKVSYGGTWVAETDRWLGLVPLGYGDGVPRHASNHAEVSVYAGGRVMRCPVVGRVCMDQFMIDLGPAVDAQGVDLPAPAVAGDTAVLFGNPERFPGCPSVDDWAQACDTINYEIVTRLGSRVPREYV
ncbi:alanine racemase [Gleimia coleocanis DSM 15436]|uniref:Alanine racemase n=1 Tax=Gleimia coleocanis DSM 15436 TaxID=525245 RepID=C0VZ44_9ACTO|nr:alanine racemase [Gleimia coleocanis]EEH64697.1 alanine racemase [Gleimia coleocanis DSM 15436]